MEPLTEREHRILDVAVEIALLKLGVKINNTISLSKAKAKYGKSTVERWIVEYDRKNERLFTRKGTGKTSPKIAEIRKLEELDNRDKALSIKIKGDINMQKKSCTMKKKSI